MARHLAAATTLALLALILPLMPALAQEDDSAFRELLPALAQGSYSDKGDAVATLAATGDPRVIPVLEAMGDRNLYTQGEDGPVVIGEDAGDDQILIRDPLTLEELGTVPEDDLEPVKTNNGLRRAIREALGAMSLMGPDPALRLAAANDVFGAQDPDALDAVEAALAQEEDPTVHDALSRARAAIMLVSDEPADRLEAVAALSAFPDQEVRSLLTGLLRQNDDGSFREPEESVRTAAADALSDIESSLEMWGLVGSLVEGLSLGSILLLAAIGLAITFGVMGVINMAHGEMIMLGAYTTFIVQEVFRGVAPEWFDWSLAVAIPCAFLVAGAVGVGIERGIIRWLYGRPLETLLATWGLSLILQQAVRSIFGPTNREVGTPQFMQGAIETAGLTITYNRLYIFGFCLIVFVGLIVLMRRSSFGLNMRAVTANRPMAQAMGIRTGRVDALTFGLGSGIAGLAGVALSQVDNVSPNLGQSYIIDSFLVVVFGGVGNLWGTFAGAMSLGIANKFLEPYAGAVLGKILILVAVILFIQKRPRGLFALKGRAAEA